MQPTAAPTTEVLADQLLGFIGHLMTTTQSGVLEVAAELDLTLSQLRALFVLSHRDHDLALGELASEVGLSVAATGRFVDALVRGGLVSRREDPSDRRIKRLALTDAGRDTLDRLHAARREGLRAYVETLDDAAREDLWRAIAAIPIQNPCRPGGQENPTT